MQKIKIYNYPKLTKARLIKRYKRFLADVDINGKTETVFCPNTGSMTGCVRPNAPVLLSLADNPDRKYRHTLEMVKMEEAWVGVNTHLTNRLAEEIISRQLIDKSHWKPFSKIEREKKYGNRSSHDPQSRFDFRLERSDGEEAWVEVKSVTLRVGDDAAFPDAVTERGAKHLRTLAEIAKNGGDARMLFLNQRGDCKRFRPATEIDPGYGEELKKAKAAGVKIYAYQLRLTPTAVWLVGKLPIKL